MTKGAKRSQRHGGALRSPPVFYLLLLAFALQLYGTSITQAGTADKTPEWPKQIYKFEGTDFIPRAGFKPPPGIEQRDKQYEPSVTERDLNGDGKPELILSYAHTPGQNKVCYYIFRGGGSTYQLVGKIYHCDLVELEPFDGFSQFEGWVSGDEGIYVRALYQMCKDGSYKNTRMDIFKATRFTNDGGPVRSSKVFDRTNYPNKCD